jgi:hypothetical protein
MNASAIRSTSAIVIAICALVAGLGGQAVAGGWHDLEQYTEAFHKVGGPGQVPLGNGGQGDCQWGAPSSETLPIEGVNPPAFYRDLAGEVHLAGVTQATDAPGGDGHCGGGGDEAEDLTVFRLPPGYRPENVELATGAGQTFLLIAPDEGATIGGEAVPPGAVVPLNGFGVSVFDGVDFRAAGPGTRPISVTPAPVLPSVHELKHQFD